MTQASESEEMLMIFGNSNSYEIKSGDILREEENVEQKYKIVRINSCPWNHLILLNKVWKYKKNVY